MINLSLNKLKLIASNRGIKDYTNKSADDLIKSLSKKRIKDIKEKFNESIYKFSKLEINEIRRSFYDIKNSKHFIR